MLVTLKKQMTLERMAEWNNDACRYWQKVNSFASTMLPYLLTQ